jgi:2'-hydroxyisoflavone reductase
MTTDRRTFVKLGAAAGALSLGAAPGLRASSLPRQLPPLEGVEPAQRSLNMLILGGTGFMGPHQVRYALARGHRLTLLNRGRNEVEWPGQVDEVTADRNVPGEVRAALEGRRWDVCIDNPTTLPFWVRDAGEVLRDSVEQYIFISTISVYADNSRAGMDENTRLAEYEGEDALKETMETYTASRGGLYGPLKVASEREAEKWFPGRTTVIRPGLIVGPGDPTDRFTYWPVRIDRGGRILAPGDGTDPTQVIDTRDISEWTIRMAEGGHVGTYNATGNTRPMDELLYGVRAVTTADADFVWAPASFLAEQNVAPWSNMPVWVPDRGNNAGWGRVSIQRALDRGLTFRTLAATAADTLAWFKALPAERQQTLRAGLPADREREILAALGVRTS